MTPNACDAKTPQLFNVAEATEATPSSSVAHNHNVIAVIATNGVVIVIEKAATKWRKTIFTSKNHILNYVIALPFTFFIVCFAWVFFRANSYSEAILIVSNSFDVSNTNSIFQLGLAKPELNLLFIMIFLDW